jgi:hypothetical protein
MMNMKNYKKQKQVFGYLSLIKKVDRAYAFYHKDDFLKEFGSYMKSFGLIKISLVYPIRSISLELWNMYENNKSIYSVISNDSDWFFSFFLYTVKYWSCQEPTLALRVFINFHQFTLIRIFQSAVSFFDYVKLATHGH